MKHVSCLLLSVVSAGALCAPAGAQPTDTTLLAHYMPWYVTPEIRGYWGSHWTGFAGEANPNSIIGPDGRRDIWSNYYPIIHPYDSSDPEALECHLLQMKLAGIDGVIVDWYGISDAVDYPSIHVATEALFEATQRFGMSFAVCFEDRTIGLRTGLPSSQPGALDPSDITSDLVTTFQWMHDNWFVEPNYFHFDGRPLVLNFGPITVQQNAPWEAALSSVPTRPDFRPLPHLTGFTPESGVFTWVQPSVFDRNPSQATIDARIRNYFRSYSFDTSRVIVSANPGFNDVYAESLPDIPYRGGDTLRDMLRVGMNGGWPVIQLVTWNDYGEGTMIEPTREFGYTFLEIVQDARRSEAGASFTFTTDDLRLPAELYALRKAGEASDETLDAIATYLSDGDISAARASLFVLSGDVFEGAPESTVVDAGGTLVFSAPLREGAEGFELRWERDGTTLADDGRVSGSGSDTLTVVASGAADTGLYRLVASAGEVQFTSEAAIGAVRASELGIADFDNNGVVDSRDAETFFDGAAGE